MNKTLEEANILTSEVVNMVKDEGRGVAEVIFCVPFPYLLPVKKLIGGEKGFFVGAQNCHEQTWGAYTGEVSAPMLSSLGIGHVIIGHSERRQYFGETGTVLKNKIDQAIANQLTPIFCCGEVLEVREAGNQEELVKKQLEEALFHLEGKVLKEIIIAYEPVWAIGTGKTATPAQAQEMHKVIREHISSKYGEEVAQTIPVLYGGSVNAGNARELFSGADVDGGLVGGASLKSREFTEIVKAF